MHGLSIFTYQAGQYIKYHSTHRFDEKRRRYSASRFIRQEREWFTKLREQEEHAIEELKSGQHTKRPRPSFRRVKHDDKS